MVVFADAFDVRGLLLLVMDRAVVELRLLFTLHCALKDLFSWRMNGSVRNSVMHGLSITNKYIKKDYIQPITNSYCVYMMDLYYKQLKCN